MFVRTEQENEQNTDGTANQWYFNDLGINSNKNLDFYGFTGKGVNVAVIDTGVKVNHSEFLKNDGTNVVKLALDCVEIDANQNCTIDNEDEAKHGTHVSGIIAAKGSKVDGVAKDVNIYSIKMAKRTGLTDDEGNPIIDFYHEAVERGLKWIINTWKDNDKSNDIHIVNMSFQISNYSTISSLLDEAYDLGIVLVGSAGNNGTSEDLDSNCSALPGTHPSVITVGATDEFYNRLIKYVNGEPYKYASTCKEMDIAAPGKNIWGPSPDVDGSDKYYPAFGTSSAAPLVTGILALFKEMYPEDSNVELETKLKELAIPLNGEKDSLGNDYEFGKGFVQAKPYELPNEDVVGQLKLNSDTKLYEYPSLQANVTFTTEGTYNYIAKWKTDEYGQYQWYKIDLGNSNFKWVNLKGENLESSFRFTPASKTLVYDFPDISSPTSEFGLEENGKYATAGYDFNSQENRYNWYKIDSLNGSKWFYKDYEKYKTSLTRDGITDGVITDWDDYISSTIIQEMKNDESTSERFANFEEQNLFTKNEYTEIMTKHATKYKKRYLIHAKKTTTGQQKLYFSFSDSELYFERPGSISYIKANDGGSFRIINPEDYYDQFYSDGSYTSYSDLFTFDQITFVPITDKSFFQSFQIHTLQQYYLHDEPNSSPLASSVSPQTLTAVFQYEDWYQINTWLGEKWIQVPTGKLGSKAPTNVNQIITINGIAYAKEYPLENDGTSFFVQDATYTATKQYDDWYFIKREDGNYYWVQKNDVTLGNFTVRLTEQTNFYNQPNGVKESSLSPQDVIAFQRQGDWFEINTWLGKRWIIPNNEIVVDAKTVSYSLVLTKTYLLHDLPFDNKVLTSQVSPQTVNVKGEWIDSTGIQWLKIQTWLGDKWIKMN